MATKTSKKHPQTLLPILGIGVFAVLYAAAARYYPGGSQFDRQAVGFSWAHNYWCNLLNDEAINGQPNAAQPIAIAAMLILCASLAFFWLQFPAYTPLSATFQRTIQLCGASAMAAACFLFTKFNHDAVTNLASVLGVVAMTGTFIGVYKNGWTGLFYWGMLNILLVVVNNVLYYNADLIFYLPVVQKFTFIVFLGWICAICLSLKNEPWKRKTSFS